MTNPKRFYEEVEEFYVRAWQNSKCKSDSIDKIKACMEQSASAAHSIQRLSHFLATLSQEIRVVKMTGSPDVNLFGTVATNKMLEVRCVNVVVLGTTNRPGGKNKAWAYIYLMHPNMPIGFFAVLAIKHKDALKLRGRYVGHIVKLCIKTGSINAVYPLNKAYKLGPLLRVKLERVSMKPQILCTPPELILKITRGAVVPNLIVEAPRQTAETGLAPSAAHLLVLKEDNFMLKDIPNKMIVRAKDSEIVLDKDFYISGSGNCIAILVHLGSSRGYILGRFDCECKSDVNFKPYIPAGFISDQPIEKIIQEIKDKALDKSVAKLLYYPPLQKLGFECDKWLFDICKKAKTTNECILEIYGLLIEQRVASVKAPTTYFAKNYPIEDLRLWLEEYCCQNTQAMHEIGACCHFLKICSQNS